MKLLYILFAFFLTSTLTGHAQRFEMIWSDEFDAPLDEDTWTEWNGTAYNNEHQFYTPRDTNVYTEDGLLHLVGLRENYGGRSWTSGRVRTQESFDFQYGRVEIRAKLPAGRGLWPAFWMLGRNINQIGWPYSGEIDIMEYRGHIPNQTSGTIHFSAVAPENSGNANADRRYIGQDYDLPSRSFASDFHLFQFSWNDSLMVWYIDDVEFFRLTKEQIESQTNYYPFDQPFYLILNLAIGGDFLGDAQPDASTPDRNEVLVDYVRVYQDVNKEPEISLDFEATEAINPNTLINFQPEITDEDGTVQKVEYFLNGELYATDDSAPYNQDWRPGIDGCYDLEIKARDNDNGIGLSETITFVVGSGCERDSYHPEPAVFPGTLQLEHYDYGGQDVGYFELTPDTNLGNAEGNDFRITEGVDLIPDPNETENYLITNTQSGEWTRYQLIVEETGLYDLELRTVPGSGSARINFNLDGDDWIYFTRIVEQDEESYNIKVKEDVELEAGSYDLEMNIALDGGNVKPDYLKAISKNSNPAEPKDDGTPVLIQLNQNYPNPFNPSTEISFTLPAAQHVKLDVYNSLGRHIRNLHSGVLSEGTYSYTFDAANLSSGVYYYQLSTDAFFQTRKMILLK